MPCPKVDTDCRNTFLSSLDIIELNSFLEASNRKS